MSQINGTQAAQGPKNHNHNGQCHENNGHHKALEELQQLIATQLAAQAQQAMAEVNNKLSEPPPPEPEKNPAKLERLIYEAKFTRGVDQGQALRELDKLTGGQPATNALMRSIV